ncbi:hypothetical protein LIER_04746 [Lithospermum erythrorhizon]|uniref:Uncharacterized protein n=1 Tax=Lithospermum erythrorhizon TaxID=34254 RepID=A0AAV3NY45_LITER
MLIKSREAADPEANLRESFEKLRKCTLRLNLADWSLSFFKSMKEERNSGRTIRAILLRVYGVPVTGGVLQFYSVGARPVEPALSSDPIRDEGKIRRLVYCTSRVVKLSGKHLPMDFH